MDKAQALAKLGHSSDDPRFANINAAKDVWWVDIPLSRLETPGAQPVDLLLFDSRSDELHHLRVPVDFVIANLDRLHVRDDVAKVSLELAIDPPVLFRNVNPVDSDVSFAPFLVQTL